MIYSPSSSYKPVWMYLFCWTQRKIFWTMWETEQFWGTIDFHSIFFSTMEVNGAPKQPGYKLSSKYIPLCSAEQRNSYRFGTTWGWVNDDRIKIFGWTIPLSQFPSEIYSYKPPPQYLYFSSNKQWACSACTIFSLFASVHFSPCLQEINLWTFILAENSSFCEKRFTNESHLKSSEILSTFAH